tara:strand:+ start:14683 stop:15321 length:639 start_codon:yes stop_codon:yes gene_type:complete
MNKTVVSIAVLIGMASSGALAKSADAFITQCKAEMIEAISPINDQTGTSEPEAILKAPNEKEQGLTSKNIASQKSTSIRPKEVETIIEVVVEEPHPGDWCETRKEDELYFVNEERGYFGFYLKKGALIENLERLVDSFYPNNQGLISRIGDHVVPANTCIVERNKDLVFQQIVEPYFVDNNSVQYGSFTNNVHAVFYRNDPEFSRYFSGVRR